MLVSGSVSAITRGVVSILSLRVHPEKELRLVARVTCWLFERGGENGSV